MKGAATAALEGAGAGAALGVAAVPPVVTPAAEELGVAVVELGVAVVELGVAVVEPDGAVCMPSRKGSQLDEGGHDERSPKWTATPFARTVFAAGKG